MSLSMVFNSALPSCSGSCIYFLEGKMLSWPGEWGWGEVKDKKEEVSLNQPQRGVFVVVV